MIDGRVFIANASEIGRRRLTSKGLTAPRRVYTTGQIAGVAASPRGYLVVLGRGDAEQPWRLGFYNPRTPQLSGAALPIAGVGEPLSVAYVGAQRDTLVTLQADSVSRIDTSLDDRGRQQAVAVQVARFEAASAMTPMPDGDLVVAETSGRLWRVPGETIKHTRLEP